MLNQHHAKQQGAKLTAPPACVVAIGASAGSLEAFERFFRNVAHDVEAAFVVIHHVDPAQKSFLTELLTRWTSLPVESAKAGVRIQGGRIYVREAGSVISIKDGLFIDHPDKFGPRERHPIDIFMSSLAASYDSHAIGIILSGTGNDGTQGLRMIRDAGGRTLVQDPSEAKFDGMPESAIAAGVADRVLPVEALAKNLSTYVECLATRVSEREHMSELTRICEILQKKTGHDFSSYKKSTVARRVERRLQANLLPNLASYIEFLEHDAAEPRALLRDLLISVTQFFRDSEAFRALEKEVVPHLFENVSPGDAVRVWVPGCATGEEAYTIAILLRSYQQDHHPETAIQIFATDIDRAALEYARQGLYPFLIAEHVPEKYLKRWFKKTEKGYQTIQELREICLFSEHSLLKHPPFSKIDLISCRNLFIYWEPELQSRILPVFHYALNPTGYLFLGPAESISGASEIFRTIDKKHRIFQKVPGLSRSHVALPISHIPTRTSTPMEAIQRTQAIAERDMGKLISSALLDNFAPPAFVIGEHGEIAYYSGRTGRFVEPPTGIPTNNLFDVIVRPLRPELHALLHRCIKTGKEASHHVVIEKGGAVRRLDLSVRPLTESPEDLGLYLVAIQEVAPPTTREEAASEGLTVSGTDPLVQQLEEELRETRENLQSTIEEVRSSNEELLSMNEELQSANEELQTSKEELQSTNEELETVNSELAKKVEELDASNSDLQNFFQGSQVPILFLDREFRIQKFTPAATRIFRLIPTDLGRRILDITCLVEESTFLDDFSEVLRTLQPIDHEVRSKDASAIYLMRVSPYRTVSNFIAGVVVTFSDITDLKRAQEAKSILAAIVESSSDAIVGRDLHGNVTSWNKGAEAIFGYTAAEAIGRPITLIVPREKLDEYYRLEKAILRGESVSNLETERIRKDGRRISVTKTMSPIGGEKGEVLGMSVIYRDITERKRAEVESATLAAIVKSSNDAIISKTLQGIVTSWNQAATAMFGYAAAEMIGKSIRILIPPERKEEEDFILASVSRGSPISHYETERIRKDGTRFQVSLSVSPVRDSEGHIIGAAKIARDITHQKEVEAALREAVRARDEFLSIASHELKTPLTTLKIQSQLRKRILEKEGMTAMTTERFNKMVESEERQIERLTRLIDDMLDITRIASGRLAVNPEPVDLEVLIREVLERSQDQLQQAECVASVDVRSSVRGNWDRFRIEQVATNLLSNAMKYGAGKPIEIRIDADEHDAILSVRDHGIGIATKDQERIFAQFERAVSRNEITGLGLGLYIVRQIVDAHGGSVSVKSSPGKGSTFTVRLPLTR